MHLILTSMHIHTQRPARAKAHTHKIYFLTNDVPLFVKVEEVIPFKRKIIICTDIVCKLLFL